MIEATSRPVTSEDIAGTERAGGMRVQPGLEESLKAFKARVDHGTAEGSQPPPSLTSPEGGLILGKFKTPEDLARAYTELEQKLSAGPPRDEHGKFTTKIPEPAPADGPIPKWAEHYAKEGKLPDEAFTELEGAGIPRPIVEQYIRGLAVESQARDQAMMQLAGGAENYRAMTQWASRALSPAEQAAYNDAVGSADPALAKLAVDGLVARWRVQGGGSVAASGRQSAAGSAVAPFGTHAEMIAAMSKPEFDTDARYRAEVEARVAVSASQVIHGY